MTTNRAYLIIPKLIEQPTWGGNYIMNKKGWSNHPSSDKKIGQSYELSSESFVSLETDTKSPDFHPEIDEIPDKSFQLKQIAIEDTQGLLGTRGERMLNGQIKTLIKFTQAKGNSFQLHVKSPSGQWLPKPESWYFFKKGRATLGISDKSTLDKYKQICSDIELFMKSLSEKVISGSVSVSKAREQAKKYIKDKNPYQFVNTVNIPSGAVVDIHQGGIHHSWEEDNDKIPDGNIVYEVQVDVMDDVSTLRSFDKGKIQEDGSVRKLQIDDYFNHLDTADELNDPDLLIKKPNEIFQDESCVVASLFDTNFYKLDKITLHDKINNDHTDTKKASFHHIFVQSGDLEYRDSSIELSVSTGHSIFIPASIGSYSLNPKGKSATILKTYV